MLSVVVMMSMILAYNAKTDLTHLILHAFYFACFSAFYVYVHLLMW